MRSRDRECPALTPPDWVQAGQRVPTLSGAIEANSTEGVCAVLDDDPFVLVRPIDRRLEPYLTQAVQRGCSPELLALLLEHGVDPNARGPQGTTALDALVPVQFVPSFDLNVTKAIFDELPSWMQQGAMAPWTEPTSGDDSRETEQQRCDQAAWLLAYGADVTLEGKDGLTVAERAEKQGLSRLAHLLRHWAGKERVAFHRASTWLTRRRPSWWTAQTMRRTGTSSRSTMAGQAPIELLPDSVLGCICDMLTPMPA